MSMIPEDALIKFFKEATVALNEYSCDTTGASPLRLSEQRRRLLEVQRSSLRQVVEEYNNSHEESPLSVEQVQEELRDLNGRDNQEMKECMAEMNDAARLAFGRVVLEAEFSWDQDDPKPERAPLKNQIDGPLDRSAILEFCGLCCAVVKMPNVELFLRDGTPMCTVTSKNEQTAASSERTESPQKRLEEIQRLLMRAVGYDPDYSTEEIRRVFFVDNGGEFANDVEVQETVAKYASQMTVALTNASLDENKNLSDQHEGGVTRVVSVQYSEMIVDPSSGTSVTVGGAPHAESMQEQVNEQQQHNLDLARQAAVLQQEILGELLNMSEEDREANLATAKEAHDSFLKGALEMPAGTERVSYLRSVDPQTQRLLVMHKLWTSMLAKHEGMPPKIHPSSE